MREFVMVVVAISLVGTVASFVWQPVSKALNCSSFALSGPTEGSFGAHGRLVAVRA